MRVLRSGADAFRARGHDAMSCDLLPTDVPGPHYQGDVRDVLDDGLGPDDRAPALHRPRSLGQATSRPSVRTGGSRPVWISCVCYWQRPCQGSPSKTPNPLSAARFGSQTRSSNLGCSDTGKRKETHLWLKGLPSLVPTRIVSGREQRIWKLPPSPDRWKIRSETYQGIADAMAEQWGGDLTAESSRVYLVGGRVVVQDGMF